MAFGISQSHWAMLSPESVYEYGWEMRERWRRAAQMNGRSVGRLLRCVCVGLHMRQEQKEDRTIQGEEMESAHLRHLKR